jgi:hypothetical protein
VLHVVLVAKQSAHAAPPDPHERFVKPARHWFPLQQPGQFAGPHAGFEHVPALHAPPGPHARHARPPCPHMVASVPGMQVFPSQHPRQFAGPHVCPPWHTPPAPHTWLSPAQFVHWVPAAPHAVSWVPSVQRSPMQHPAQFAGPQGGGVMHVRPFG